MTDVHIGITGTRHAANPQHYGALNAKLQELYYKHNSPVQLFPPTMFFHHGDCIGFDAAGAKFAWKIGYVTVAHPPINPKHRAFHTSHQSWDPRPYLKRNKDIVDEVSILIVCPRTNAEELRSGTWATYREAKRQGKRRIIIWPSGNIQEET